jgi:two-component system, NarL family, nitrate/nitrite response regulator NarL
MITHKLATQPIRVVIVHSHQIILEGLRMLVDSWTSTRVVGVASDRTDAVKIISSERPDIVLLDFESDSDQGTEWFCELSSASPESRLIVLTQGRNPELHHEVIGLGAVGIVDKQSPVELLSRAFEKVHAGEIWLDRAILSRLIKQRHHNGKEENTISPEAARIGSLTDREREVVTLVGEGLKAKHIASRLFISETTVRHHLTTIFSKLNVSDRFELLIYAYKYGLATPPCRQPCSTILKKGLFDPK